MSYVNDGTRRTRGFGAIAAVDLASGHSEVRSPTRTEVRSPTRTEVRSPTRTEVRSPTRTATEVRSPTSTSTDAYTQGNFTSTVTGGAGAGATHVTIYAAPLPYTVDSRGRKQLAKTAMDVDTTAPASSGPDEIVSGMSTTKKLLIGGAVLAGLYFLTKGKK